MLIPIKYNIGEKVQGRVLVSNNKCTFCNEGTIEGKDRTTAECPICKGKGVVEKYDTFSGEIKKINLEGFIKQNQIFKDINIEYEIIKDDGEIVIRTERDIN